MTACSLFLLCVKVILNSTFVESACAVLPPTLLHYLLYQAIHHENILWIYELVRYWPCEKLSFDFDKYIDDSSEEYIDAQLCDLYLRRHHSWYYSPSYPILKFPAHLFDTVATGLYLRLYQCQSVKHVGALETKQFLVDLSMVGREEGCDSGNFSLVYFV